jgi:YD repeat-containing protein
VFSEHDDYERPRRVTYLDGTSTYTEFGCCGPTLMIDRDGATTTHTYDALKRRETESVHGLIYRTTNDAAGRVLARFRQGTDGTVITNASHAYDLAGRLTNTWDAVGQPTKFHETNAPGRRVTTTYADGGVRVQEYFRDGTLKRETGTAAFPVRFEYGVTNGVANGQNCFLTWRKETKLDHAGNDTPEWTMTLTDPAGRDVKTLFAASAGQPVPVSERVFNLLGQLSREIDPDGVTTLHQYNGKGEPVYRVLDVNRNGVMDSAAGNSDQIVETLLTIAAGPGDVMVRREQVSVAAQDGSPVLTPVSVTDTSLDGLRVWQTVHGQPTYTETIYNGPLRTVTVTAPDGTVTTSTYNEGRLVSVTVQHPVLNETLRAVDFTYDAHGRQAGLLDQRTGLTTNVFDAADRVQSTTLQPPGANDPPLTTSHLFDPVGRVVTTFLPDGASVTRTWWSNGLPRLEHGARVYPHERRHDAQGRPTHLITWTNFATLSGAATNQWRYDAHRGWLTNRVFAGSNGVFYSYTNSGRLALRRWARGVETRYGFDTLGQLSVANHSDATPDVFLTRDRLGRPRRVEERGASLTNVTTLTNHLAGHLLSEARGGVLVTNGYDALLRRTQMRLTVPLWNETTTYGYDPASRLVGVTNGGYATEYQYLPGSSLVWDMVGWDLATPGGPFARLASQRVFDGLDRVTELNHLGGGGGGGGALAAGYATGYNPAGQRPSVAHADGTRWEYQYDPLGQLSRAERFWPNGLFFLGQQSSYTHDTAGNRVSARSARQRDDADRRAGWHGDGSFRVQPIRRVTARHRPRRRASAPALQHEV